MGVSTKRGETVGLRRAKEWDKDASLTSVGSVDEKMGSSRGVNGKRFNWNLNFTVPNKNKNLIVGIKFRVSINHKDQKE